MSVGLEYPNDIQPIRGIRIGAVNAGISKSDREDLAVFAIANQSAIAGVFTKNRARAAPVDTCIINLNLVNAGERGDYITALVVNSGNANAGVGVDGLHDCRDICTMVADQLGTQTNFVLPFSTGVIGERLPMDKFRQSIPECVFNMSEDNWLAAARAIMTTDTIPKAASRVVHLGEAGRFTITGISKGSGMIQPNMATMLAFIATDADMDREFLESELEAVVQDSFNRISVDGDTSTNDSCVLIATGASGVRVAPDGSRIALNEFRSALQEVAIELAQAIVRDGEGATKFVTIEVSGADTPEDCVEIARTVANSPLVKTALHASDPNWGRIYGAIGRARVEELHMSNMRICIDDVEVMREEKLSPDYSESRAMEVMEKDEFTIFIDVGMNDDEYNTATIWTCDFSAEYVRINAEYRT